MSDLPNRNEIRLPALDRAPAPYEPPADHIVDSLAANVVTCSIAAYLANRFLFRVFSDKWAVACGVLVPFVGGPRVNSFLADVPRRLVSSFQWSGYRVSERYSANPRN